MTKDPSSWSRTFHEAVVARFASRVMGEYQWRKMLSQRGRAPTNEWRICRVALKSRRGPLYQCERRASPRGIVVRNDVDRAPTIRFRFT